MNKVTKILYSILIPAVIIVLAVNLIGLERNLSIAENDNSFTDRESRTEGNVDFQIATTSYGGEYEPEHVFAIWVTDENDEFVRTLVRRAWEEIEDLVKWNDMTGGNYQNAIVTGATINNHTTHNISWDCTDNFLSPIPDGIYRIYTEFSEDDTNTGGPWTMVEFTKGPDPVSLTPAPGNNFHNIELTFTPSTIPDPTIEITSPANNTLIESLPFTVEFAVENFDPTAGDGYIGLYINDQLIQNYPTLDPISVINFPEGENDLKLILLDQAAVPLDPEVSDTITLTWNPIGAGDVLVGSGKLLGNYPNPFNPTTTIYFDASNLHESTQIEIYNMKGQVVKTFDVTLSGVEESVTWNGTDDNDKPVSSGVYYYVLKSGIVIDSKKMVLLK